MSRFVLVPLIAAGLCACNGSEGGAEEPSRLTKAQYEDRMEQIREELEPMSQDMEAAFEDGEAEEGIDLMADAMDRLADELGSIEPPRSVAQAHDDFAASLKTYAEHARAAADVTSDRGLRRGVAFFVRELPQETLRLNQRARRAFEREGYDFGNLQPNVPGEDAE
jgi:hypothetical protein